MVRRIAAVWLVLLILSPFTAPFATCDASSPASQTAAVGSGTVSILLPPAHVGRTRLAVLLWAPTTSMTALPIVASRIQLGPRGSAFLYSPLATTLRL